MQYLITIGIAAIISLGSLFGYSNIQSKSYDTKLSVYDSEIRDYISQYVSQSVKSSEIKLGSTLPIAGNTYNLAGSGVSSSATSFTLQSFTITQTGQLIQDSDMSDTFYLTLEPGSKSKQEIVSCTTVTQNSGGTATLSGCSRGLSPITPYTASTTLRFVHGGGTQVIFSDPPQLFNQYAAKENTQYISGAWIASSTNPWSYDQVFGITASTTSTVMPYASWVFNNFVDVYNTESIAGVKTFTATTTLSNGGLLGYTIDGGSNNLAIANKSYVDGVVTGGAANANTTTKGLVEEATVAEIDASSSTGGTGAKLFMTPASFAVSNLATTTLAYATTSQQVLATTTLSFSTIPNGIRFLKFFYHASTSVDTSDVCLSFNSYTGTAEYAYLGFGITTGSVGIYLSQTADDAICLFSNTAINQEFTITGELYDIPGQWKYGTLTFIGGGAGNASFKIKNTARITSMTVAGASSVQKFGTSTYMSVVAY